ncbi:MAG: SRPBCC family protein, partial [Cyanobacteria bacterium REEB65]|nr:SRPBCC family protein [Cyanobacteria bacterium REEB65]
RARLPQDSVPDEILALRIRSRMGRYTSHPHAIAVEVHAGRVVLSGPVLEHERHPLARCVRTTPGVVELDDRLEAHRSAEAVPALQGGVPRRGLRPDLLQDRWAPTTRLLVGTGGLALGLRGLLRGGPLAPFWLAIGTTCLARATANQPLAKALGIGVGRRLVDFQKTFEINAPIWDVWEFWQQVGEFPHVMAHVLDARRTSDGRCHWTIEGPIGLWFDFDAQVIRQEAPHFLEWETMPDAELGACGSVRLEETATGGTRIDIKIAYHPPFGLLGHAVAWSTGTDPHHALNDDMVRVKSFLEEGKTTVRGREVTRQTLPIHATPPVRGAEEAARTEQPLEHEPGT